MLTRTAFIATVLSITTATCPAVLGPAQNDGPVVEIQVDRTTVSPSQPLVATVTASNPGRSRVTWGPGSSTCQLALAVRMDGADLYHPGNRPCTADSTMHVLEPGESRTEEITWDGGVWMDGSMVTLEPGTYDLRGLAPPGAVSPPVTVTVIAD